MNTQLAAQKWAQQPPRVEEYWASRGWDSRKAVLGACKDLSAASIVELGCHSGPMLKVLSEKLPGARIAGVEVNRQTADECRHRVGCPVDEASLMQWLPAQPPESWDVLVTHYTLAYVSPEDLPATLWSMWRVCRKGLVIAEPTGPTKLVYEWPEWQHPYPAALRALGAKVEVLDCQPVGRLNAVTVAKK